MTHTERKSLSVVDSRAKLTVNKYVGCFRRCFLNRADKYKEIASTLPSTELHVGLYLQHLMKTANHFSSVENAFFSIKWAHQIAGVSDPCISEVIKNIVEASKKINCVGLLRRKNQ